jgi:hypothetical protein
METNDTVKKEYLFNKNLKIDKKALLKASNNENN